MKVSMRIYCFLISGLVLTACGEMHSNNQTVKTTFLEMYKNGEISAEHLSYLERNVNPEMLNQPFEIIRTSDTSLVMRVGDRETPININREPGEDSPSTLNVNGHTLNLKGERSRERNRNILEGLLGLLTPGEREDIENDTGFNLGDLIDLGYSEDRDEAQLIALGTLIINALRKFRSENPDKPFVALYAFGNSPEAILQHGDSAQNHNTKSEKEDNFNAAKVISGAGLIVTLFNPIVGTIIRVLGALAA